MSVRREQLEDAFTRAEGAQEVAFRGHQKAVRAHRQALIANWMVQGRRAHTALECAAFKLSTHERNAK